MAGGLRAANQVDDTYWRKYATSPEGAYEDGDTLFLKTTVDPSTPSNRRLKRDQFEAHGMLNTRQLIGQYLDKVSGVVPPLPQRVARQVSARRHVELTQGLSLRGRVLYQGEQGGLYVYVYAVAREQLPKPELAAPRLEYWADLLGAMQRNVAAEGTDMDLAEFHAELWAVENVLRLAVVRLHARYDGLEYFQAAQWRVEGLTAALDAFEQDSRNLSNCRNLLRCSPGHPAALVSIAEHEFKGGAAVDAAVLRLYALRDAPVQAVARKATSAALERALGSRDTGGSEYVELLARCHPKAAAWGRSMAAGEALTAALLTFGHAVYPDAFPADRNRSLEEAEELFRQGRDIDQLLNLLTYAIEASPRQPRSWQLLGAVLASKGLYEAAVPVLTEAACLSPGNAEVKANLARCYLNLGYPRLALGGGWAALLAEEKSEWAQSVAADVIAKSFGNLE
jgi:tetratricopeptide (TPR) repeat protein